MARTLPRRPFLYAIVDVASLGGRRVGAAVTDLASGGAGLVQLRAKGTADGLFLELAREAVAAARAAGVPVLVNDRPDIARIAGADGVHLGQEDLRPAEARRLLPPDALVGLSTHDTEQAVLASAEPVDYVAVGPVFPTRTKAHPDPVLGPDFVRRVRSMVPQPLVAIGGIDAANAAEVVRAGADGVAVVSALLSREDVTEAAREMCRAVRAPGP